MKKITVILSEHIQSAKDRIISAYGTDIFHFNGFKPSSRENILDTIAKVQSEEKLSIYEYNSYVKKEEVGDYVNYIIEYTPYLLYYRKEYIGDQEIDDFITTRKNKYVDEILKLSNDIDNLKLNSPEKQYNCFGSWTNRFQIDTHRILMTNTQREINELTEKTLKCREVTEKSIQKIKDLKIIEYLDIYFYDNLVDKA